MIDHFESSVRINPDGLFLVFTDADGRETSYTYMQARLVAASLARKLLASGIAPGDALAIDLPNSPEFVFVALAAAYGGFSLVMIDGGLSERERLSCVLEVERSGHKVACAMDDILVRQLMRNVRNLPREDSAVVREVVGQVRRNSAIMGEEQDLIDDVVHFAERAAHLFDREALGVVVFADASKGRGGAKARGIPLTWAQLLDGSRVVNHALAAGGSYAWQERLPLSSASFDTGASNSASTARSASLFAASRDQHEHSVAHVREASDSYRVASRSQRLQENLRPLWQCALPLSGIEGFQLLLRSVVARTPLRLYELFDAEQVLRDAEAGRVSHIAVDDGMLQDMLTVEEWRADAVPGVQSRLVRYRCVLLVDNVVNERTVQRVLDIGARVFSSYGFAQTSGPIALTYVSSAFDMGATPIPAYDVRIVDPDDEGYGRLAVSGPGVFDGYLNGRSAFTVDRFFITEEKAALRDGLIYVKDRKENMFVSAGQNIYPVEIADVLRHVPGVSGVHVFGVPDSRFGMVPIAVIERSDPSLTPQRVEEIAHPWLSSIHAPVSIFVFDQLPRTERGRLDRPSIEALFA